MNQLQDSQLVKIFESLGVDQTVFYQFAVFLVVYIILKQLFLKKLQFVLELRESKTTKLETKANEKFQEAEKLAEEYRLKMVEANQKAQKILGESRAETISKESSRMKEVEASLAKAQQKETEEFQAEIENQKAAILNQTDKLSDELVGKLI